MQIEIIIHYPETPGRVLALRRRVAAVHAQEAFGYIDRLSCPERQKAALARAVLDAVRCKET